MINEINFSSKRKNAPKIAGGRKPTLSSMDQRMTTCTDCKFGIFTDHKYKWTSRGLVHIDCGDMRLLHESHIT